MLAGAQDPKKQWSMFIPTPIGRLELVLVLDTLITDTDSDFLIMVTVTDSHIMDTDFLIMATDTLTTDTDILTTDTTTAEPIHTITAAEVRPMEALTTMLLTTEITLAETAPITETTTPIPVETARLVRRIEHHLRLQTETAVLPETIRKDKLEKTHNTTDQTVLPDRITTLHPAIILIEVAATTCLEAAPERLEAVCLQVVVQDRLVAVAEEDNAS